MSRSWILIALATVTAVLGVACGGGDTGGSTTGPSATSAEPQPGGTLHIALISDVQDAFDPQKEYSSVTWEYFRCCLVRTLLSYNGQTTDAGGSELRPDLAAEMPVVSDDGLTWTFTLKQGIKYGPPLQDVTVTSPDFVRALEREACGTCNVGGYSFYYSAIEGFDEFAAGDAESISGLETPDDTTLVVTLDEPTGDLGNRLAMPASAPIPPLPGEPKERLGAATGHDADWGQYLVATGPYMFEGFGGDGLHEAGEGAGAGGGLRARPIHRPGSQPVVGRLDRRATAGVRGSHRDHDRRHGGGHRTEDRLR